MRGPGAPRGGGRRPSVPSSRPAARRTAPARPRPSARTGWPARPSAAGTRPGRAPPAAGPSPVHRPRTRPVRSPAVRSAPAADWPPRWPRPQANRPPTPLPERPVPRCCGHRYPAPRRPLTSHRHRPHPTGAVAPGPPDAPGPAAFPAPCTGTPILHPWTVPSHEEAGRPLRTAGRVTPPNACRDDPADRSTGTDCTRDR